MASTQELNILSLLLPLAGIVFVITIGVILLNQHFRKNLYRQLIAQEELKNLHQQELLKSSIEVQERERKRIAQDLHDELGASLSIARMHLMQLEERNMPDDNTNTLQPLQNVRSLTESALASMRRISHELMPPQLEAFGLIKTLEAVAAQVSSVGKITVHLQAQSALPGLPWFAELGLYRIVMELINNTIKHAGADEINITLSEEAGHFVLRYHDNGKGYQLNVNNGGLGLKNLEARASSLKGTTFIGNDDLGGFSVRVNIPLQ